MVCYLDELREADEEKKSSRVARYLYSNPTNLLVARSGFK